jgi:hypothetical protein
MFQLLNAVSASTTSFLASLEVAIAADLVLLPFWILGEVTYSVLNKLESAVSVSDCVHLHCRSGNDNRPMCETGILRCEHGVFWQAERSDSGSAGPNFDTVCDLCGRSVTKAPDHSNASLLSSHAPQTDGLTS